MTDDGRTVPAPPALPASRRPGRRWPGPLCWLLVGGSLAGIVVARAVVRYTDYATTNVVTIVLSLVAVLSPVCWFLFLSGYPRQVRRVSLIAVLAAAGLLATVLRIQQVSGELLPRFVFFWQTAADWKLDKPVANAAAVDLATTTPYDFPQFLGPQRNAHVPQPRLAVDWQTQPPQEQWRIPIGAGWSSFAIVNGLAVTMEQRGADELVTCYAVATGELKWSHSMAARFRSVVGGAGPRATPTIHHGRVYALGATGFLRCLDGATGQLIWSVDLLQQIGVTPEQDLNAVAWGRANSPLVVDDLIVVPVGGPAKGPCVSLAAYRQDNGHLAWSGGTRQASYSSPVLATVCGTRQILIVCQDFVAAHQPETGAVLWEHPWEGQSTSDANVSQAVPVAGDRVLLSKAYHRGGELVQVRRDARGAWQVGTVWRSKSVLKTKFTNVVVRDGFVYALSDGMLECVELDTGQRRWKEGRYGQGQVLGVGEHLIVQAESGEVVLVAASPEAPQVLGRLPALHDKTWNNPALYDHLLLVRNAEEAACFLLP